MRNTLTTFILPWLILGLLIGVTACKKNAAHEAKIKRLESDIRTAEERLNVLEEATRGEGTADPGHHTDLLREKDLLSSRLERLKENLRTEKAKSD